MKKLLLMMILFTLYGHSICIITTNSDGPTSVEIDGRYYDWSSLSMGKKDSCRRDTITRKNKEIAKEQQKNIKQEKSDTHSICRITTNSDGSKSVEINDLYKDWSILTDNEKSSCLKNKTVREEDQQKNIKQEKSDPHSICRITTNSDGSKSVEINDLYKDWSILTDNEKSSCLKDKTVREKELKKEQQKNIKQEKRNEHYTCILFTLDNNWVAEINGKYYEYSNLSDNEKASCQKDKIEREKAIRHEHQSNITNQVQEGKNGSNIWLTFVIIFGFLVYLSWLYRIMRG